MFAGALFFLYYREGRKGYHEGRNAERFFLILEQQADSAALLINVKRESLLNRVPRVPACRRFLSVLACLRAMRAFVLWRAIVPACLRALACQRACVPTCHGVPTCHWNFYVLACHPIFDVPSKFRRAIQFSTCHSNFGVPFKLRRAIWNSLCNLNSGVPYLYSGILSILSCFEGWCSEKFCPEIEWNFFSNLVNGGTQLPGGGGWNMYSWRPLNRPKLVLNKAI